MNTIPRVPDSLGRQTNFIVGLFVLAFGYLVTIYAVKFVLQ
jgi:hypothetical protein